MTKYSILVLWLVSVAFAQDEPNVYTIPSVEVKVAYKTTIVRWVIYSSDGKLLEGKTDPDVGQDRNRGFEPDIRLCGGEPEDGSVEGFPSHILAVHKAASGWDGF